MDDQGRIYTPEEMARMDEDLRQRLEPIPAEEEDRVRSMSRHERRAWYARRRRAHRRARRARIRERRADERRSEEPVE